MDAVVRQSEEMIRKGSKSFALASRLFDAPTRERAVMLYAWCRHCDDEIDGQELGMVPGRAGGGVPSVSPAAQVSPPGTPPPALPLDASPQFRLQHLRNETRRALAGERVTDPVFVAFQRVAAEARIPERHAMEFLAGFEMDVAGYRYESFEDTLLYCYRVAGVVGVMMALVMGVRDPQALQRAADLGIAFQLTNISRDVLDDARNGRCYVPAAWLRAEGLSAADLKTPARPEVARLARRLLDEADRYYASAGEGLRALSFRSAWAVATALYVYRDIGRVVRQRGEHAWDRRAVVGTARKLLLVLRGAARAGRAATVDRRARKEPRSRDLWLSPDLATGSGPEV